MDACGVEHVIEAMQHGYVQCIRPGCTGLRNYRRRELQLLLGASGDEESQPSASERGTGDPLDDGVSDQGSDLEDGEVAGKEPGQVGSDET